MYLKSILLVFSSQSVYNVLVSGYKVQFSPWSFFLSDVTFPMFQFLMSLYLSVRLKDQVPASISCTFVFCKKKSVGFDLNHRKKMSCWCEGSAVWVLLLFLMLRMSEDFIWKKAMSIMKFQNYHLSLLFCHLASIIGLEVNLCLVTIDSSVPWFQVWSATRLFR